VARCLHVHPCLSLVLGRSPSRVPRLPFYCTRRTSPSSYQFYYVASATLARGTTVAHAHLRHRHDDVVELAIKACKRDFGPSEEDIAAERDHTASGSAADPGAFVERRVGRAPPHPRLTARCSPPRSPPHCSSLDIMRLSICNSGPAAGRPPTPHPSLHVAVAESLIGNCTSSAAAARARPADRLPAHAAVPLYLAPITSDPRVHRRGPIPSPCALRVVNDPTLQLQAGPGGLCVIRDPSPARRTCLCPRPVAGRLLRAGVWLSTGGRVAAAVSSARNGVGSQLMVHVLARDAFAGSGLSGAWLRWASLTPPPPPRLLRPQRGGAVSPASKAPPAELDLALTTRTELLSRRQPRRCFSPCVNTGVDKS